MLNGYVTMVTEPYFLFTELYEQRNNLTCLLKEMMMDPRREAAAQMAILALENRTKNPKKTTDRNTVLWYKFVTSTPSTHIRQLDGKLKYLPSEISFTTPPQFLETPKLAKHVDGTTQAEARQTQPGDVLQSTTI